MRTFIETLTTDQRCNFDSLKYDQLSLGSQAKHLVRQCFGMKYLKVVYGDGLWFLYRLYHNDLEAMLASFKNKVKTSAIKNDLELASMVSKAITICDNALFDEPLVSPISLGPDDFNLFYMSIGDEVPMFGSIDFVRTFLAHLTNRNRPSNFISVEGGSILAPYNALCPISSWRELAGTEYKYEPKIFSKHAEIVERNDSDITPFFKLLVSIKGAGYLQSPNCLISLLAAFMIDPDYLTDYCGYLNAMTGMKNAAQPTRPPYINTIIYKGCYRVLFDELDDSVFQALNNQCKCAYVVNKKYGFTLPNTDVLSAKNFLWLISYISDNQATFFADNQLMAKLIMYFEPRINPNEIPQFLNILHRLPEITVEEENTLARSGLGNLFRKLKTSLNLEDDQAVDDTTEEPKEDDADTSTDDVEDANTDDSSNTGDDFDLGDDDEFGDDSSDDITDDTSGDDTSTDTSSEPPPENLPEYLFKLGAPPELDSVIYRLELDRKITEILKDPPRHISGKILKLMKNLQAYWLHLINLDTLKRIINIINEGVKQ